MMIPLRTASLLALLILFPVLPVGTALAAELININTADASLLDTLPGIGLTKAAAIVDYRAKNGLFASIADIQNVSGIGPVTFANMEKLITVGAIHTSIVPETVVPVQPPVSDTSYKQMKAARLDEAPAKQVEPIISPKKNIQAHEQAVIAPTAAVEPAAVGAALSPAEVTSTANTRASGFFDSVWTLGLLGVIVLAAGAFIFF
jgi:competence ComEA-like helix-hairpin-helix protein